MNAVSTHVLDSSRGCPAAGVLVPFVDGERLLAEGVTDDDGRVTDLGPDRIEPGTYPLVFDVGSYDADAFFPEVTLTFIVTDDRHHHVSLLIRPFAYSIDRGNGHMASRLGPKQYGEAEHRVVRVDPAGTPSQASAEEGP